MYEWIERGPGPIVTSSIQAVDPGRGPQQAGVGE